jgi:hypothetical protein
MSREREDISGPDQRFQPSDPDKTTLQIMSPAGGQDDVATDGQPFKAGVTVHLQNAMESFQMSGRPLALAVGTVEVDGGRRIGPVPASLLARIDPEAARLGPPSTGIEHRNRRIVREDLS